MNVSLLLPSDVFNIRQVDGHFQQIHDAALELGYDVALVQQDPIENRLKLGALPDNERFRYLGWMMDPEMYSSLSSMLELRGRALVTSPKQYSRAHLLPNWYPTVRSHTPQSEWIPLTYGEVNQRSIQELLSHFTTPVIIKDYVKSLKQYWDEACYIPDPQSPQALQVVNNFLDRRERDLVGGLVVREFESFIPGEWRSWWHRGEPKLIANHPDYTRQLAQTGDDGGVPNFDLNRFAPAIQALECDFVTVDLRIGQDGQLRIIEVGDGGVSDMGDLPKEDMLTKLFD